MNRVVRRVFFGGVLAAFVVGSAASLSYARQDHRSLLGSLVPQSAKSFNTGIKASPTNSQQPPRPRLIAYVARLSFKNTVDVPFGFLTFLAGSCLVVPFGLTTWATLRRRL
jgi:hypothetical protein